MTAVNHGRMERRRFQEEEKFVKLPPLQQKKNTIYIPNSVCRKKTGEDLKLPALEARREERQYVAEKQLSNYTGCPELYRTRDIKADPSKKHGLGADIKTQWLNVALQNLQNKRSKQSGKKLLEWLNECQKTLKKDVYKPNKPSLGPWILNTWLKHHQKNPEVFDEEIEEWVKICLCHITFEGPTTCRLTPQKWVEKSILAIQKLSTTKKTSEYSLRKRWLP
ncbi:uncharacterized protein LOC117661277 [Pantherophis guttatus]|uniref:Uncharacterized protein LOC117661277 n=1 Tax=Pantherophis guttatus TaxID=94885 RepID=A0A6P9B4E3_PANGU|nr:uncharacterized protein LOC117661277 [Pantherophis guttatus]